MNRNPRFESGWTGRLVAPNTYRVLAGAVAVAAGLVVFTIAHDLFPYHSSNHDEGVYLQQAAMLLDGRVHLTPGSDALREAVHPWFFVESEAGLYPKYAPVPAAMFAVGMVAGDPRLALAVIAAINVGLGYVLASAAFDRRTGVVAGVTMAAAPLFLLPSSVFLPYAPTTALNLLFAVAYVRSVRRSDPRYAALAGAAIGLAFFARPYTALLFASPFAVHAIWRIARPPNQPALIVRYGLMAAVGATLVGVTLAYNAFLTGSPFLFPYEAFAPRDGLGFGRRAILGYERLYTPALAIQANALLLWHLTTDWFTAGPVGVGFAAIGLLAVAVGLGRHGIDRAAPMCPAQLRLVLVGILVSVVLGNLFFWGNLNLLGDLTRADDGLISLFGPFYHFDLLLPLSALAAHAAVTSVDELRTRWPGWTPRVRVMVVLLLATSLIIVTAAEADALGPPIDRHAASTAKYDRAYAPFETADLEQSVVFLPTTYGEWRNHPFQWLRNDPGLDGTTLYVLTRNPRDDFAVLDTYPGHAIYRYRYHGAWTPRPHNHVHPVLERVRLVGGRTVTAQTTVGVPARIVGVDVAVSVGDAIHRYRYRGAPPAELTVRWQLSPDGVTVTHSNLTSRSDESPSLRLTQPEEVVLAITITEPGGGSLTYREALHVRPRGDGVEVLWPPASSTCVLVTDCGLEGTYIPDQPATRPRGITMNTSLVEGDP